MKLFPDVSLQALKLYMIRDGILSIRLYKTMLQQLSK